MQHSKQKRKRNSKSKVHCNKYERVDTADWLNDPKARKEEGVCLETINFGWYPASRTT